MCGIYQVVIVFRSVDSQFDAHENSLAYMKCQTLSLNSFKNNKGQHVAYEYFDWKNDVSPTTEQAI